MLLGVCLMSIGANYFNAESKNIQINKFVAGSYQKKFRDRGF